MAGNGRLDRIERTARGVADDVLTLRPRARSLRDYRQDAVDRLVGADPGLTQLRRAMLAVSGIAAAVGLVDLFVHATGALTMAASEASPTVVAAHNHAVLLILALIAGMMAMLGGANVSDDTATGQLVSTLLLPAVMIPALALGLGVGPHRIPSLVFLVALLTGVVYVRRWGPRMSAAGLAGFNGGFVGFFLHTEIGIADIGWLAAAIGIGALSSLGVRFLLFRPNAQRALNRMRRSWTARAKLLLGLSIAVLDAPTDKRRAAAQERIRRQLVRLNESSLMIEARLSQSAGAGATQQAQRLFDAELALANCSRFAGALARSDIDLDLRRLARSALTELTADSIETKERANAIGRLGDYHADSARITVLAHRLAHSCEDYATARAALDERVPSRQTDADTGFVPAVELSAGYLPGSGPVSAEASSTPGRQGMLDRATMAPHIRASIQITVAGTIAVVLGDALSHTRLYWAVLAAFLAFMATANSGEQLRKALFRVTGTGVGIVLGDLLVRVTGGNAWSSLLIVLVSLFFGIWLIRVNYTFMVIGVTVTMSQLYAQLGEFSWQLLVLRLAETAVGVGAVVVTVLVIVPLRPQRVLTTAILLWFRSQAAVLDEGLDRLTGTSRKPLLLSVRQMDAAYAAFESSAAPLRTATFGRNYTQLAEIRSIATAVRTYTHSFTDEAQQCEPVDNAAIRAAASRMRDSVAAIERRIASGEHGSYARVSALIEIGSRSLTTNMTHAQLAMRDLTALDGALARFASALAMEVEDLDTTTVEARVASASQ